MLHRENECATRPCKLVDFFNIPNFYFIGRGGFFSILSLRDLFPKKYHYSSFLQNNGNIVCLCF